MKILINYRISLFILLFFATSSYAYSAPVDCGGGINGTVPDMTINAGLTPSPLNYSGPANKSGYAGAQYSNTWSYFSCNAGYQPQLAYRVWAQADPSLNFDKNGLVTLTLAPGVGLKIMLGIPGTSFFNFKNNSRNYIGQIQPTNSLYITAILPDLSLQFNGISIKSGSYTIPATKLLTVELRDPSDTAGNGNKVSYATLWLKSFTINATTATCTVNSNNLLITFPSITANSTNNVSLGSALFSRNFSINLSCPATNGPNIYTTFTDNINPANFTNILSLDQASSAQGIGVQIKYNNSPIKFGPDSGLPATTNQFLLKSNANGPTTFNFDAQLIKTGVVSIGDYKATATFTLSYQ